MAHGKHHGHSEQMLVCIQNCQDCHRACLQTLAYGLDVGGRHAEPAHLRLMMDCAEVCQTAANFMIRGSALHGHTCAACAVVCARCAEDCERMADDLRMKACADTCRHCAESCSQMAADLPAAGGVSGAGDSEGGSVSPGTAAGRPSRIGGARVSAAAASPRGPRRHGAVMSRKKTV